MGSMLAQKTAMHRRTGDADFYRVISMLRELQASDSFGIRVDEGKGNAGAIMVFRALHVDEATAATARKVRELLHLNPRVQTCLRHCPSR